MFVKRLTGCTAKSWRWLLNLPIVLRLRKIVAQMQKGSAMPTQPLPSDPAQLRRLPVETLRALFAAGSGEVRVRPPQPEKVKAS